MAGRENNGHSRSDDESMVRALGQDSGLCAVCKKTLTQSESAAAVKAHLPGICGEAGPMYRCLLWIMFNAFLVPMFRTVPCIDRCERVGVAVFTGPLCIASYVSPSS